MSAQNNTVEIVLELKDRASAPLKAAADEAAKGVRAVSQASHDAERATSALDNAAVKLAPDLKKEAEAAKAVEAALDRAEKGSVSAASGRKSPAGKTRTVSQTSHDEAQAAKEPKVVSQTSASTATAKRLTAVSEASSGLAKSQAAMEAAVSKATGALLTQAGAARELEAALKKAARERKAASRSGASGGGRKSHAGTDTASDVESLVGSSLAGMAAKWGSAATVGTAVVGALRVGDEFARSINQMNLTFQGRADSMIAKAQELSDKTNKAFSFTEVAYAFTKTADSFERYGITGEQSINLVAQASELAAAKGLELKDTIDRLESGIRGEAEASEYLGLTLNETYMKNMAFGGSLRATWEKLTDNEKAAYRYQEILKQSEKYTGATAKASETLSGSLTRLWKTVADDAAPEFSRVSKALADIVNKFTDLAKKGPAAAKAARDVNDALSGAALMMPDDEPGEKRNVISNKVKGEVQPAFQAYLADQAKKDEWERKNREGYEEINRKTFDETRSSHEKYSSALKALDAQKSNGLDSDTYDRARTAAWRDYEKEQSQIRIERLQSRQDLENARDEREIQRLEAQKGKSLPSAPSGLGDLADYAARYNGLDESKWRSIVAAESSWNKYAVSPKGAMGLTQLMPGTARDMGVSDPFDAQQNMMGGAAYYKKQLDRFGSYDMATTAYNLGPENAARIGRPAGDLFEKTSGADADGRIADIRVRMREREIETLKQVKAEELSLAETAEDRAAIEVKYAAQIIEKETAISSARAQAGREATERERERRDTEVSLLQQISEAEGLSYDERRAAGEAYSEARKRQIEAEAEAYEKLTQNPALAGAWKKSQVSAVEREERLKELSGRETTASLKYEALTQVSGSSMKDQLSAQIELLEAERERAVAAAEVGKQQDYIAAKYNEQIRLARLRRDGSFGDGLSEGLNQIRAEIDTTSFDQGVSAMQSFKSAVSDASDELASLVTTGKADFSSLATSIISDLLRMQIEAALTRSLFGSNSSGSSGLLGSLFSFLGFGVSAVSGAATGAGTATAFGTLGSTNLSDYTSTWSVMGHANGGVVDRPTLSWVGEGKYSEAIVPLPDGRSIPAVITDRSGRSGSSQSIQLNAPITVSIPAGSLGSGSQDTESASRWGVQISSAVRAALNEFIDEQQRPGGAFNKGMRV